MSLGLSDKIAGMVYATISYIHKPQFTTAIPYGLAMTIHLVYDPIVRARNQSRAAAKSIILG
jgi:hypothetical protein